MIDDTADLFFTVRRGRVWACFFDGRPPIELSDEKVFWETIDAFAAERFPEAAAPTGPSPAAPPTPPVAAAPPPPTEAPPRSVNERDNERHEVVIVGKVFSTGGSREVTIADLSTTGCRFDDYSHLRLVEGGHLTIRIGTVGPVPATVRWLRGTGVGVQFDSSLHPSVLDHIRHQFGRR